MKPDAISVFLLSTSFLVLALIFPILFVIKSNCFCRVHFETSLFITFDFINNTKLYYIYIETLGAVMKNKINLFEH